METINTDNVDSICINCCGLIGDTLIRTPIIEAIKLKCKHAKITVIVDTNRQDLLSNHPDIDSVLVFRRKKKPLLTYIFHLIALVMQLRFRRYDLMINLYGSGSSVLLSRFSRTKYTLGFYKNNKQKKSYSHGTSGQECARKSQMSHWGQCLGLMLAPVAISPKDIRAGTTFVPTSSARLRSFDFMPNDSKAPWVLINLGAGDPKKTWSVSHFVALSQWISMKYNYNIGVFINPGQEVLAQQFAKVAHKLNYSDFTFLDVMDFPTIGALMERSRFVVTGDTGYMHIAIGVKTPVLAIFTYTRPEPVYPSDVLFVPCFRESAKITNQYGTKMADPNLSVDFVKQKAEELEHKIRQHDKSGTIT